MLENLKTLCMLPGVSGDEAPVREWIAAEIKDHCDEMRTDALGNLIVLKKGKQAGRRLMLSAHMDEVGFVVTSVDKDGSVRFDTVGGVGTEVLAGRLVRHMSGASGVIMTRPIHLLKGADRDTPVDKDALQIDFGPDADAIKAAITPGDTLCFADPFTVQSDRRVLSKALDDRVGCLLLMDLLKEDLPYDITVVFSALEEVGAKGALTAANQIRPEYFIAVETTTAADIAGVSGGERVCALGEGAVVPFMDRGTIYDKGLYQLAFSLAKEAGIPLQTKTMVAGGNDAGTVHRSGAGVKSLAVALPCRYLHTAGGVIDLRDYDSAKKMLSLLVREVPAL